MSLVLNHWIDFNILSELLTYTDDQISFLVTKCIEKQNTCNINLDPTSMLSISFTTKNVIIWNGASSEFSYDKINKILNFIIEIKKKNIITIVLDNIKKYNVQMVFCNRTKLSDNVNFYIDCNDGTITHEYISVPEIIHEPSRTVEWKTTSTGWITTVTKYGSTSGSLCYSHDYGKYRAYQDCCWKIILNSKIFYSLVNGLQYDRKILRQIVNNQTQLIEPQLLYTDRHVFVNEKIIGNVIDSLKKYYELCNTGTIVTKLSLVARIGGKRDWRSTCFYCLEDENMGQTCKCGYHQTIMFDPCGHTMCLDPCFINFISLSGICDEFGYGPVRMLNNVPCRTVKNTDAKMNFTCPCCKNMVNGVFCVEKDVFFEESDKKIFDDLYGENVSD